MSANNFFLAASADDEDDTDVDITLSSEPPSADEEHVGWKFEHSNIKLFLHADHKFQLRRRNL